MNFKVEIPVTCEKSSGAQKGQDYYSTRSKSTVTWSRRIKCYRITLNGVVSKKMKIVLALVKYSCFLKNNWFLKQQFPTIFLVRGGSYASKHPSSPPCATKTHLWPPEPSEGDISPAPAQHSRSRDEEGGDFPRRAVDSRLRSRGWQWALRRDRAAWSLSQIKT